ncbi:Homeodomain-like protein [Chlamydoabsidia padenii]|nr:Homeodomain-like protein [Chlamydoabsidia padenii]
MTESMHSYVDQAMAGSVAAAQAHYYHGYYYPSNDFRPTFYNPFEIKHRRRTSRAQLKVLEKAFSENPKPNANVRRYLAQELDMTPRGVQIWFQNRRAKAKLLKRKQQQQQQQQQADSSFLMTPLPSQPPMLNTMPWMNNNDCWVESNVQRRQSCPLWNETIAPPPPLFHTHF